MRLFEVGEQMACSVVIISVLWMKKLRLGEFKWLSSKSYIQWVTEPRKFLSTYSFLQSLLLPKAAISQGPRVPVPLRSAFSIGSLIEFLPTWHCKNWYELRQPVTWQLWGYLPRQQAPLLHSMTTAILVFRWITFFQVGYFRFLLLIDLASQLLLDFLVLEPMVWLIWFWFWIPHLWIGPPDLTP